MLSFSDGKPIAHIIGGPLNNEIIFIRTEEDEPPKKCCRKCSKLCYRKQCCKKCSLCKEEIIKDIGNSFKLKDGKLFPLMNTDARSVNYIAGPSGSGKSTFAGNLIEEYRKIFPEKELFIFSRTDAMNDPALKKLKGSQIEISNNLIEEPIDIEKELSGGCVLLFDDCNTIQNAKFKKAVDDLIADILETGRKLGITIIITNHLVIPNEKKIARTILNELQYITVFPRSGSAQQITYALKTYFGLTKKQIETILQLPSRWVTISKSYPMYVIYEKGCYLVN